jgi:ATP-binding cassette subfamily G (WHITE) protein 2 (SNQ2)
MPFLVIMCELFNGTLRPQSQMPAVWKYTMYYVAPFTYWIGGILSMTLSGVPVSCDQSELNFFNIPMGQTCAEYAKTWIAATTGYLVDGDAMGSCGYCQYQLGDDVSFFTIFSV